MTRIIFVLLVALGVALYFPESRAVIMEKAKPVVDPILAWQATDEMEALVRDLRSYEQENYDQLPDPGEWDAYLEQRYSPGAAEDGWGTRYHFTLQRDSFYIVSHGPDKVYGTDDDIRVGARQAAAR